jgi:hypothetical protein
MTWRQAKVNPNNQIAHGNVKIGFIEVNRFYKSRLSKKSPLPPFPKGGLESLPL